MLGKLDGYMEKLPEWEQIIANSTFNKGLMSKIYKELIYLNIKTKKIQLKKWAGASLVDQ